MSLNTSRLVSVLWCLLVAIVLFARPVQAQWTTTQLSQGRTGIAATVVGRRVLFAGGDATQGSYFPPFTPSDVVDIYDASAGPPTDPGAWSVARLVMPRAVISATSAGHYALFTEGYCPFPIFGCGSRVVDVYDDSTGEWSVTRLSSKLGSVLWTTTVGDLALFSDGLVVEFYDASLGHPTDPGAWWLEPVPPRAAPADGPFFTFPATAVGRYALLWAGESWTIFDAAGGTWSRYDPSGPFFPSTATTVGDRAVFAGLDAGWWEVSIYDLSLGEPTDPLAWSQVSYGSCVAGMSATGVGEEVLFAGGAHACNTGNCYGDSTVLVYDLESGQWRTNQLSVGRAGVAAVTQRGRAFLAGGGGGCVGTGGDFESQWVSDAVDVYWPGSP